MLAGEAEVIATSLYIIFISITVVIVVIIIILLLLSLLLLLLLLLLPDRVAGSDGSTGLPG